MLSFHGTRGVRLCDGLTRRDFLHAGGLSAGAVGLSLADLARLRADPRAGETRCILLFLVGGPSHLDTWDPKPHAPDSVRGPFRPIPTSVPGIHLCEHLPRMASLAERYAIVRSVHHEEAPIHETGQQLMQTGRLCQAALEHPHYGAVVSRLHGLGPGGVPAFAVLPGPVGNTGVSISHGQGAGYLGARHEPVFLRAAGLDPARPRRRRELPDAFDCAQRALDAAEQLPIDEAGRQAYRRLFAPATRAALDLAAEGEALQTRYGRNTFGQSCLLARRLVEHGVRLVTVNMFDTVFNAVTWDCHADGGPLACTLHDYRQTLCPMFDQAYSALLEDLHQRGLLETTLVVAMGEFGRTPRLNARGGRDHWPGVWSVLFAGGGVRGGQVIGASDRLGAEPQDRPVTPAEVAASVYRALGIDLATQLPGPDGRPLPLVEADPIAELFH
jgi:uncharacterized protein (DUF1501 family)